MLASGMSPSTAPSPSGIAKTIRSVARAGDQIFRYGGEEIVVLLPEQPLVDAIEAANRIRRAVENLAIPRARDGRCLTISAGVAELDTCTDRNIEDWIARADASLYVAKSSGRNRVAPSID
jgi:diguanylate cyclase (GGDEF)-like protein